MKFKILAIIAAVLFLGTGCNSTPDNTTQDSKKQNSPDIQVAQNEPTINLTVVSQSLKEWPYERSKLTYTLHNHNFTSDKEAGDKLSEFEKIVENNINIKLANLGLTKIDKSASLEITYGLTAATTNSKATDAMFDTLGVTTGSTTKGSDAAINVSIKELRSNKVIWSGVVSASSDKPIITPTAKNRLVNSLLDSLFKKLPVAN
ncbi:MAG: hypothetical protein ACI4V7_05470 [Succinivibrionaceae bacterium]